MIKPFSFIAGVLLVVSLCASSLWAQRTPPFDFETYPSRNFRYEQMKLEMKVDPALPVVEGMVHYTITPIVQVQREFSVLAFRIEIDEVVWGNSNLKFALLDDTLRIDLGKEVKPGERAEIGIRFKTEYDFGLHKEQERLVWSSFMPYAQAHIFPGHAHPRTEVQSEIHLWVPEQLNAVANGRKTKDQVEKGLRHLVFNTDGVIALSEVGFVVGNLEYNEIRYGAKVIQLYAPKGLYSDKERNHVLSVAYDAVQKTERRLAFEYPSNTLSMVLIPFHRWETKQAGNGLMYVFDDAGRWEEQIQAGVFHQWFGALKRPETWYDATSTAAWSAWLFRQIYPQAQFEKPSLAPRLGYKEYSLAHIEEWVYFLANEGKTLAEAMNRSYEEVLKSNQNVWHWRDYARVWYRYTGQKWDYPVFTERPEPTLHKLDMEVILDEMSYEFFVQAQWVKIPNWTNTGSHEVNVQLETDGGIQQKKLKVLTDGKKHKLDIPASSLNMTWVAESDTLQIRLLKPSSFWFYQLRKASNRAQKLEAALALAASPGDPDMQLALRDMLKNETDAEIKAALMVTLSGLTKGATGTEQLYLEAAFSTENSMQRASLIGLRNFPENEQAIASAQRLFRRAEAPELKLEAFRTLLSIMPKEDFFRFSQNYLERDSSYVITAEILQELNGVMPATVLRQLMLKFLAPIYPQQVRLAALNLLKDLIVEKSAWLKNYSELIKDNDPYIRYIAVGVESSVLDRDTAITLLNERLLDEFDYRVRSKITAELDKLSAGLSRNQ